MVSTSYLREFILMHKNIHIILYEYIIFINKKGVCNHNNALCPCLQKLYSVEF